MAVWDFTLTSLVDNTNHTENLVTAPFITGELSVNDASIAAGSLSYSFTFSVPAGVHQVGNSDFSFAFSEVDNLSLPPPGNFYGGFSSSGAVDLVFGAPNEIAFGSISLTDWTSTTSFLIIDNQTTAGSISADGNLFGLCGMCSASFGGVWSDPAPVPEPSSGILLAGVLVVGALVRHNRQRLNNRAV